MSGYALDIALTVNGERISERVDARKTLVDFLREDLPDYRNDDRPSVR